MDLTQYDCLDIGVNDAYVTVVLDTTLTIKGVKNNATCSIDISVFAEIYEVPWDLMSQYGTSE